MNASVPDSTAKGRAPANPGAVIPTSDVVLKTFNSGFEDSTMFVIRTSNEWTRVWQRAHANMIPVPPVPAVDFASHMLVGAAMGTRPSGGHDVQIERIEQQDRGISVQVTFVKPGSDCMTTSALTQPVIIVRVPRVEGSVVFAVKEATTKCG